MGMIFTSGILGSIIVGAVVLGLVVLAVCSMISDKKKGKSLQCGGDCKHCGGHCGS
ncbi:MAG: FeoB-associated Cys-rich membrane protein [Bacteroides sp.]|nr:FeoB-associated Cys-rich membrane protein [Bacteroides sp.]MCM1550226.1 FeoB-associated Cys-rich membrane protein [Clostridium sp.]